MPPQEIADSTTATPTSAAAKLFDIRIMIGGLFTLYGVMLTVYGFFTSPAQLTKAAGVNMNLWLGVYMLALGVVFLVWARRAPTGTPDAPPPDRAQPDA